MLVDQQDVVVVVASAVKFSNITIMDGSRRKITVVLKFQTIPNAVVTRPSIVCVGGFLTHACHKHTTIVVVFLTKHYSLLGSTIRRPTYHSLASKKCTCCVISGGVFWCCCFVC